MLNKPEYTPIKVIVLVIVLALAGYFVFASFHSEPGNTGQVAKKGTPVSTTTTKTSLQGTYSKTCDDTVLSVTLDPSFVPGSSATNMSLNSGTYPNTNVALGTFRLTNPSPCPMTVHMMKFATHPSLVVSPNYSALQNIRLTVASTGAAFAAPVAFTSGWNPATGTWATPSDLTGSVTFTATTPVLIPAFSSEDFKFVADGRNVAPPTTVSIQLVEMHAMNVVFAGMANDEVYPGSMGLVQGPLVSWGL